MISVIIPVRNEEKYIYATLVKIHEQTYPHDRIEIIIVDGMSNDNTINEINKYSLKYKDIKLNLIANKKCLSSSARNLAIRYGVGDYYLLIDGHVYIPSNSLIEDSVKIAIKNNVRVLGRAQPLSPPDINKFQKSVSFVRESKLAHSQESYIYSNQEGYVSPISVAVMYHKTIFKEIGLFDEEFDAAEDLEFNYRIEKKGIKCYISPKFTIYYYPRDNLISLFNQTRRYGEGRARFVKKHPERFTYETILPSLMLIIAGILTMSSFVWVNAFSLFMVLITLYVGIIYFITIPALDKKEDIYISLIPIIVSTIYVGFGIGFFSGLYKVFIEEFSKKRNARMT